MKFQDGVPQKQKDHNLGAPVMTEYRRYIQVRGPGGRPNPWMG